MCCTIYVVQHCTYHIYGRRIRKKYIGNHLADMLITEYNRAVNTKNLDDISEGGYFMFKATQEDFDRQKAEGEAIGEARGEARGEAKGEANMIKRLYRLGKTVKQIAEFFQTSEEEIESYLAME